MLLAGGAAAELALLAAAALAAAFAGEPFSRASGNRLAGLCALAMGVQNAVARQLAVPDLTTTVLTMTLTGMAANVGPASRRRSLPRRLLAVATCAAIATRQDGDWRRGTTPSQPGRS